MDHVVLEKFPTPVVPRGWNWMAYLGGDAAESYYGFGATELAAFNDLLQQMEIG